MLRNQTWWVGAVLLVAASSCGSSSDLGEGVGESQSSDIVETNTAGAIASTSSTDAIEPDGPATILPPLQPFTIHVEGHRGARGLKPENTLQAFETALDIGVSTLELDLHLSSDGQVVVWHDDVLGPDKCRFADHVDPALEYPDGGVAIASITADQLSDYYCDINPDPQRFPKQVNTATALAEDQYQPVTLAAVFSFVERYVGSSEKTDEQRGLAAVVEFNIETKREVDNPESIGDDFNGTDPGQFELEVLDNIESAGLADRVVIQSFDHRSLLAIRSVDPDIRLAALTAFETPQLPDYAAFGAAIWSPNFNVLTEELLEEAHALGLLVIPWTINEASDMVRILDLGSDGFITDRPDIAASLR
ncbi:MAG: glycerophosphodiester phosphodiesterase family protein [Acidimicrobiales bacterium]